MTDQEIIESIAEKFLGWHKRDVSNDSEYDVWLWTTDSGEQIEYGHLWNPLTDPAACALVLDEIERRGWAWRWEWEPITKELGFAISIPGKWGVKPPNVNYSAVVAGDMSRYRPVCLTALRALGVEVE